MEASQVFYSYLSRTLARPPRCQRIVQPSNAHLTRPHPRRKQGARTFTTSQRRLQPKTEFPSPTSTATEASKPVSTEDPPQPARSFRRQVDNRTAFVNKYESPQPPAFGSSSSKDVPEDAAKAARPTPEEARSRISALMDAVYMKGMVPERSSTRPGPTARRSDKFDPAIYDTLSAYESKPRTARPLTPPSGVHPQYSLTDELDASDILRDHEASVRMRLKPTLGRTVPVNLNRNVDLTRAFRMLEFKNQENSVKQDEREQRFHVRKGQMRKIMRRRRWRVTFLAGYLEECKRVRRMRKQGW